MYDRFKSNPAAKWENMFQPGWFKWIQDGFDLNLEFFEFYEMCEFEHFMIAMAILWTTIKGFLA